MKSIYKDIVADKAAYKAQRVSETSQDGQAFKDLILTAALHLLENWVLTKTVTAKDTWYCAATLCTLGDGQDLVGKNAKSEKQKSMKACISRLQRWLRFIPATPEQSDEIVSHVGDLLTLAAEGTLTWAGSDDEVVDEASLIKRLTGELSDLLPKLNEHDTLVSAVGGNLWRRRLHTKLQAEPYPTRIELYLGEDSSNMEELFLAAAFQIALKMAVP